MSGLKPETLEIPDRVRRQIEEMASRLEAAESELRKTANALLKCAQERGAAESALRSLVEADEHYDLAPHEEAAEAIDRRRKAIAKARSILPPEKSPWSENNAAAYDAYPDDPVPPEKRK